MAQRIQFRRGTAAEWIGSDPVLAQGEIGYATDTGELRIGDGSTAWSTLDAFIPDGDSIPTSEKGAADGVATLDGSGTIPDAQIPATIARDSEITAAVSAAVDALVAGAPGALDTLNELAAAIGDDADFAGTITAALAGKATSADLTAHTGSTANPHTVTKSQVGLGNVDNTSDANKPVSTATQTALDAKAPLASPTFTGTVTVPTATASTSPVTKAQLDALSGTSTLWIPATGFTSVAGSPSASVQASRWPVWLFDQSIQETVGHAYAVPSDWSTADVDLYWSNPGAGSGNVVWTLTLDTAADAGTLNASGTNSGNITDAAPAQHDLTVLALFSGATVTPGNLLNMRLSRVAGNGSDTLANDASLLGVKLTKAS